MSAPQNVHVNPAYLGTYLAARIPAPAPEQPTASEALLEETGQRLSPPRPKGGPRSIRARLHYPRVSQIHR